MAVFRFYNNVYENFGLKMNKNPPIDIRFSDIMKDWLALQKYLFSISDSKDFGFQITLYRQFMVCLRAALLPPNPIQPLENKFTM